MMNLTHHGASNADYVHDAHHNIVGIAGTLMLSAIIRRRRRFEIGHM
jgi:hypothetical protein